MTYHDYKVLHHFVHTIYIASAWLVLINHDRKIFFYLFNLSTVGTFILGVGLLNRFGITLDVGYPFWVWMKISLMGVVTMFVYGTYFKIKEKGPKLQFFILALALGLIGFSVYKPS